MPLTFPSHAAVVLPLWRYWPRRWEPVSLVIGSTAPDLAFAFGIEDTHRWDALLWWSVPVGMVLTVALRWSAPRAAVHLPKPLRRLGSLGDGGPRWWACLLGVVVGAVSHLLWDGWSHYDGYGTVLVPALLHRSPFWGMPWYAALQWGFSGLGAVVAVVFAVQAYRDPRVLGPAPQAPRRPLRFTVGVLLAGLAGAVWTGSELLAGHRVMAVECLLLTAFALPVAGALAVSTARSSQSAPVS
ncbi:DUF4184 family protein [Kutzneria viridogrisea]|uniref:DUF4184 family protein n=2 Tax=Kutzneria TaxID=43356 RepID=W5WHA6_9PSEU|nr:DUF4184 family protein [Kutzneria albida]AHI00223.1 hypothetical protein KALB_6864 [Kutzneria albida DSM 43870]MBA8925399.1 hypothetical protein [Kutzneria viridogrisea]